MKREPGERSEHTAGPHSNTDDLWRWLLGGLAGGGIILGILIAAYAIGYHRGQHHPRTAIPPVSTTDSKPTSTSAPTTTALSPAPGPVEATPALIARGKTLYVADGCSACHSLTGKAGVGPSLKDIAGRNVTLTDGQTITSDDAYLEQSIANPDAEIVKGYDSGAMSAAIESYNLSGKPDDIRALVAFIKAQK